MFKESYRELFTVKLSHEALLDNFSTDEIQLSPSQSCTKLLEDLGLFYQALGNRYSVFYKASQIESNPAQLKVKISDIPNDTIFRFVLNPDSRGLAANSTNLPAITNRSQQIYKITDPKKPTTIQLYEIRPAIVSFEHISVAITDLEVKVLNEKNALILSKIFEKPKKTGGFEDRYFCSIDLSGFTSGVYTFQFWVNGVKEAEKSYFIDTLAEFRGHLAIVEISKKVAFDAVESLPPNAANPPIDFEIAFEK